MKCCDCGLVHEAEFGVVRYKSETEREDCDRVDDPNLQAVFRMRRSEEWSPEDTAHRAGGMPMAQPEQEPVAWGMPSAGGGFIVDCITPEEHARIEGGYTIPLYTTPPTAQPEKEPLEYWNAVEGWVKIEEVREHFDSVGCGTIYKSAGEGRAPLYTTPPQRTWVGLSDGEAQWLYDNCRTPSNLIDMTEAKLKELNT
jgi:hypothetical protein